MPLRFSIPFVAGLLKIDVAGFVNDGLKTMFLPELLHVFRHPVLLLGGTRDLCYFIEIFPQKLRFKILNFTHNYLVLIILLQCLASQARSPSFVFCLQQEAEDNGKHSQ
jgi:hypothetical protein